MTKPPDYKIYLASKSARRRELLRQIGVEFELISLRDQGPRGPDVPEVPQANETPPEFVARVTMEKAMFARSIMLARRMVHRPILAADTTVVLDGNIMGKPSDMQQACDMIKSLSGRTHEVLTSVVMLHGELSWQLANRSEVTFGDIPDDLVRAYCASTEPYDKAGGYGIQGAAGMFVKHISGSYSGVMGLPLYETAQLLKEAGIKLL